MSETGRFKVRVESDRCQGPQPLLHDRARAVRGGRVRHRARARRWLRQRRAARQGPTGRAQLPRACRAPRKRRRRFPMSFKPADVADWATDFDHTHPRWTNDPYPIWEELRGRCPVASSERFEDGAHLPVTWDTVREVAYDTEHFSSRRVVVRRQKFKPLQSAAPITSDPPEHRAARMPLLPPFNPMAVEQLEAGTRDMCHRLIDGFIAQGGCCGATDYAQHIPTRVIAKMLGLSEEEGDKFRRWIKLALQDGIHDPQAVMQAHRRDDAVLRRRDRQAARAGLRGRRPDLLRDEAEGREGRAAGRHGDHRHAAADPDRRHRHHLERDRCEPVAPGHASRGPPPPGHRARAVDHRPGGTAARLCPGDDGARGDQGRDHRRLPDEVRLDGAAVVPCGQPRPGQVLRRRQG